VRTPIGASGTSDMTLEGLREMFQGDSADMCAGKSLLMLMGGRAKNLACSDLGARTPVSVSGILGSSLKSVGVRFL
jgi:hypothetical protein